MWSYGRVKVHWLGHDSFVLEGSRNVVIDPFKAKGNFKADFLLISHEHFDHLSVDDIERFSKADTTLVAPKLCETGLKQFRLEKKFVFPDSRLELGGVTIEAVPAYNVNKFKSPGEVFHPKQEGRVGYVVTLDGSRFYHAGDTDAIPEMNAIQADVSMLPVSGTYVMTAQEAAIAAKTLKTKVILPMHYGAIVGTRSDAEKFKTLVGNAVRVEILEKE